MGRLRKRTPVHFGIDTFYAYLWRKNGYDGWIDYNTGREIQKSPLDVLSENSTLFGYDKDTRVELLPEMSDKKFGKYFIVTDIITNVKMAFICFGKANNTGGVERKDRIEVTGSGLILRSMKWWIKLIDDLGFEISGFKRVDICIDVKLPTDYLVREVFLPNVISMKKTHKPHNVKGEYTGLEIGEKAPKNTWKFIRIYNKILDTNVKDKSFLYDTEKMGPDYTRIELELRRDKCRDLDASILLDTEKQFDILAYEVFWIHYQFFNHIHKNEAIACVQSHLIDCFKDESGLFKKTNVSAGVSRQRLIDRMERILEFGNGYKTEKDARKALSTLRNMYMRLRSEGIISKEDIQEVFAIIEMDISMRKEGKIVDFSEE